MQRFSLLLSLLVLALATIASSLVRAAASPSFSTTVPGSADPWLAGLPPGLHDGNDAAPDQSPVLVPVTGGLVLTFDVAGAVGDTADSEIFADGNTGVIATHTTGLDDGLANVHAPANSLVGVFLNNTPPDQTPAPSALDYSDAGSREQTAYTNLQLKQVFFIGDGRARSGPMPTPVTQQFTVPAGATALFLGVMDTSGDSWAGNVGSFSVTVNTVAGGGLPAAPTGLHTTSVTSSRVSLAWSFGNPDPSVTINIERSLSGGTFSLFATVPSSQTSFNDDSVSAGSSYVYRLRAVNSTGVTNGTNPDTLPVTVPTNGPPAPTGLHTTLVDYQTVKLAWSFSAPDPSAVTINILRQDPGGSFRNIHAVDAGQLTYQDETVTAGTEYVYKLQAVSSSGTTDGTNPATLTVDVPAAPPIVHISCDLVGAPATVKPGDTLTFKLTFNLDASGGPLYFAQVVDDLPEGTTFDSATFLDGTGPPSNPSGPANPSFQPTGLPDLHDTNPLVWFQCGLSVAPGTTFKMQMKVVVRDPPGVSSISNSHYFAGGSDKDFKDVILQGDPVSVPVSTPLDVTVQGSPNPVAPGGDIKYLVTVNVNVAGGVKDLTFADQLPAGAGFIMFKQLLPKPKTVSAYDIVNNKVTFNAGTAAAGAKFQFELHLQAPYDPLPGDKSELNNDGFRVSGTGSSGALSVNPGGTIVQIRLDPNNLNPPAPKLQLIVLADVADKQVNPLDPNVRAGETITYFLHVANIGNATAKRVILTNTAPPGLTPKLGSQHGGGSRPKGTVNGQTVSWLVGDLTPDPQGDFLYTFSVTVPTGTQAGKIIGNGPAVLTAGDLLNPVTGAPANLNIPVVLPAHFQILAVPSANYLTAQNGAEKKITYTVSYKNDGGTTATGVSVRFTPPPGASLATGGTPFTSSNNGTYLWSLTKTNTLKPGLGGQLQFVVATSGTSGSLIVDPQIVAHEASATARSVVPIYIGPRLWVSIRAPHVVQAGDRVTYTIDYGNTGDTAADVTVQDALPASASLVSLARGAEQYGRHVLVQDSLQAGETKSTSITVTAGNAQLVNNGCSISESQNQINARQGRVAADDGTTRYAPSVTTTVAAAGQIKNPFQALWDAIVNVGGNALSWVISIGKTHPAAQKDINTLNANSSTLAIAGLDVTTWKSGVIVTRTGDGQVLVMAPKSVNTGVPWVSDDGRVRTYTGSPSAIHIGSDTAQSLLDAARVVSQGGGNVVAQGGGNVVSQGGGNLISSDGAGLIGDHGSEIGQVVQQTAGLIPSSTHAGFISGTNNVIVSGLLGDHGSELLTSDGAGLLTSDGAGFVQVNSGLIVTTSSGVVAQGAGN